MMDFLKKSMYVGLGLAAMTKERVESFAKEVANQTKMSEEEGRKLAEFLSDEASKAEGKLKDMVHRQVGEAADRLATKKQLADLEKKVAELEARLAKSE